MSSRPKHLSSASLDSSLDFKNTNSVSGKSPDSGRTRNQAQTVLVEGATQVGRDTHPLRQPWGIALNCNTQEEPRLFIFNSCRGMRDCLRSLADSLLDRFLVTAPQAISNGLLILLPPSLPHPEHIHPWASRCSLPPTPSRATTLSLIFCLLSDSLLLYLLGGKLVFAVKLCTHSLIFLSLGGHHLHRL